jgi:release factor glutamine methyltransferase
VTTIGAALQDAKRRFANISPSASLDAQVLLAEVLHCSRAHLLGYPEQPLTEQQATRFASWVERREQGVPIAYILGRRAFYDRDFMVTPSVLIPRPETEHLLEQALHYVKEHPCASVVDVGTGSGALAVTLSALAPQATVYAVDISPDALAVARTNAERHQTAVQFFEGDLLQPLVDRGIKVNLVMANLPYIARDELVRLEVGRHEPVVALDGGSDGLDLVRRLLDQISAVARHSACILLEIGADQGQSTLELARSRLNPAHIKLLQDLAGLDRVIRIDL